MTREECINYGPKNSPRMKAVEAFSNTSTSVCSPTCPKNHMESANNPTLCVKCESRCPKTCKVRPLIDSIEELEELDDCTIIDGSLTIEIRARFGVMARLEKHLSNVEEIRGHVNVARTPDVVSFNFLKNLRVIHGEQLYEGKYALVARENSKLEEFWDWGARERENNSLSIKNGSLYIHLNERLCYQKIVELKYKAGLEKTTLSENDVSRFSNGDRMACDVFTLTLKASVVNATHVDLVWDTIADATSRLDDERHLVGFTVFFMEM